MRSFMEIVDFSLEFARNPSYRTLSAREIDDILLKFYHDGDSALEMGFPTEAEDRQRERQRVLEILNNISSPEISHLVSMLKECMEFHGDSQGLSEATVLKNNNIVGLIRAIASALV